ncbi:MAG: hypothetical protein FWG72_10775 [Oscillospiraceae bacterium]|nr:hypothetical protein [Oscillospiraceae bacterium]
MARTDTLTNYLDDLARSIRDRGKTTEIIRASDFDLEIKRIGLPSGTLVQYTEGLNSRYADPTAVRSAEPYEMQRDNVVACDGGPINPTHTGLMEIFGEKLPVGDLQPNSINMTPAPLATSYTSCKVGHTIYYSGASTAIRTSIASFNASTQQMSNIGVPSGYWYHGVPVGTDIYYGGSGRTDTIGRLDTVNLEAVRIPVPLFNWANFEAKSANDDPFIWCTAGPSAAVADRFKIGFFDTRTQRAELIPTPDITEDGRFGRPAQVGRYLYFTNGPNVGDAEVIKWDTDTRTVAGRYNISDAEWAHPWVAGNYIYLSPGDVRDTVIRFNTLTNAIELIPVPEGIWSRPRQYEEDGLIYFGTGSTQHNRMCLFNPLTDEGTALVMANGYAYDAVQVGDAVYWGRASVANTLVVLKLSEGTLPDIPNTYISV